MINSTITILIYVCVKFQLPQPVMWICGVLLLIVILLALSGQVVLPGIGSGGAAAEKVAG